jgi:hypothetical protein
MEKLALAYDIMEQKGSESAADYVHHCMIPAADDHRAQHGIEALRETVNTPLGHYPIGLVLSAGMRIARELDEKGRDSDYHGPDRKTVLRR